MRDTAAKLLDQADEMVRLADRLDDDAIDAASRFLHGRTG
jgi:hypothetical protein